MAMRSKWSRGAQDTSRGSAEPGSDSSAPSMEAKLGHEVRLTVLGHLQRGGSPSASDRILGTQLALLQETFPFGARRETRGA